jgi:hypothetical protein
MELCFNRIDRKLRPRRENIHFPTGDLKAYSESFDEARCARHAGGPGGSEALGLQRSAASEPASGRTNRPSPAEYRKLGARIVELTSDDGHPKRPHQRRRPSCQRARPRRAPSDPVETWKSRTRQHLASRLPRQSLRPTTDGPDDFPNRLPDASVPMSLLSRPSQRTFPLLSRRLRRGCG